MSFLQPFVLAGLALAAGIALIRLRVNMIAVIVLCAAGGLLLR